MLAEGVYAVAPTPFHEDGSLDLDSIGRLADFFVGLDVTGLLVLGVMGEAHKLLADERGAVLDRFVTAVDGRVAIVAGTTFPSAEGTAELTRRAGEAGADAALISPPRLAKPNPNAVRAFYEAVATASSTEIVIQDHPAQSGTYMSAELMADLTRDIPQANSIKLEDPATPPKVSALVRLVEPGVRIYGGLGGVSFLDELNRGAAGTMTGFGYPEILVRLFRLHRAGEMEEARRLFRRYLPLIQFEAQQPMSLSIRKHLYVRRGAMATPRVRLPGAVADEETLASLTELMDELDTTD
jgi:4-hydroxy-tetrahydrodipicolinate synthase